MALEGKHSLNTPVVPPISLTDPLLNSGTPLSVTAALSKDDNRKPVSRRNIIPQKTSKISERKKRSIEVAAVYIVDAIHVRKPQTRIQEKGIDFTICNYRILLSPLEAYKFVHNKWWKIFLYVVIWIHLLCVIWAPKNFGPKEPDKFNQINTWVLVVQPICLCIFILDCALKLFCHDREFRFGAWQKMLYCVIFINTVHVIFSFMGDNIPQKINLALQVVRPYYLIYNARSLRSVIRGVVRSIPRIMVLIWVIAFTLCCFGLIGYELFYNINNSHFNTFEDSMLSLMILLTTANYPDVMMPAYHASQFYVIFFACFVIIILVLFLPTLLAVIYEGYHSQTQKSYANITKIQKQALLLSFELLTLDNDNDSSESPRKRSKNFNLFSSMNDVFAGTGTGDGNTTRNTINNDLIVIKDVWMQFMRIIRPDLDSIKHQVLFTTLRLSEQDLTAHPNVIALKLNSDETPNGITQQQFLRLPEFIEIHFRISYKADIAHELVTLRDKLASNLRHRATRTLTNKFKSLETKIRVYLLFVFSHPISEGIIDWMVWINALTFIAEKCAADVYNDDDGKMFFSTIHATFLVVFVLEIVLKIYAFGVKAFLSDKFFIFDTVLVMAGLIGWINSNDDDDYVQLIRALRLLRVLKEFPQMRLLVLFLSSLMRSFVILLLAQFCVFYIFAMIGMANFDGLLGYDQIMTEMSKYSVDDPKYTYWYNHLDSENATQRYYYLNNMNTFINTMIVLMELSVVNNWQVVMAMYIQMSDNHYNRIFFIAFYFCSVIVVLNVVIAFVINLFLVNYGQNISSNDLLFRYKRYIIMSILINQLNDNEYDIYHWTIERRIRPALWYQIIFEDHVNKSIENVNAAHGLGEGEIDNTCDYDEAKQMPFKQDSLVEQFQKFGTQSYADATTPKTPKNITVYNTPDLHQSFNDFNMFSSLNSTYHRPSIGVFPNPPPEQRQINVNFSNKHVK
eukprot:111708_1